MAQIFIFDVIMTILQSRRRCIGIHETSRLHVHALTPAICIFLRNIEGAKVYVQSHFAPGIVVAFLLGITALQKYILNLEPSQEGGQM